VPCSGTHGSLTSFKECLSQEPIILWPPLGSAFLWNPWFPSLLQGVPFSGTHCSMASLRECLFQEPVVPRPPSRSDFLKNPLFCGLPLGVPFSITHGSPASFMECLFLRTHYFAASFKEFLFHEHMVPRSPLRSAFF
jgi:hypothetical protein